jgi:hypothetical protein
MIYACVPSLHWKTLYSLNHYTATHCTITLGLTTLHIFLGMTTWKQKLLNVLLMMGILVPRTCWGKKTTYFVTSGWFFTFQYLYDAVTWTSNLLWLFVLLTVLTWIRGRPSKQTLYHRQMQQTDLWFKLDVWVWCDQCCLQNSIRHGMGLLRLW